MISNDCGFLSCSCCFHYAFWLRFGQSGLYPMYVWSQNLAVVSDIICLQLMFIYLRDELKAANSTVSYGKKEELTYKYNKYNFTYLFSLIMHCKVPRKWLIFNCDDSVFDLYQWTWMKFSPSSFSWSRNVFISLKFIKNWFPHFKEHHQFITKRKHQIESSAYFLENS